MLFYNLLNLILISYLTSSCKASHSLKIWINEYMGVRSICYFNTNENSDISNLKPSVNSNDFYHSIVEVDNLNKNTPYLNNYNTKM